ncbi:MAG: hypothetical protein NZ891_01410 [bacterium]|nr:hypothetical protein [bacterium]MDW8163385.1 flagellar hook capping FlgD N-terminal domain-containing protein [Candidatus Omnitrophota bacterium]
MVEKISNGRGFILNSITNENTTRDIFLKLLTTQIKTQNPLEPMKTQEFTSQITQLASLDQLITIERLLKLQIIKTQIQNATLLIGKTVTGLISDNSLVSGVVKGISFIEDQIYLLLDNGLKISLENIVEIK